MISDLIFLSSIHQQPSSVSCSYDVHRKTERKRSKQSGVGSQVDNKSCARRQHLSINSSSMSMMVNALYTQPLKACWTTIASHTLMRRCGNLSTYNRSYARTGLSVHHQWVWWLIALSTKPLKSCWTTIASHTLMMRRCGCVPMNDRSRTRSHIRLSIHHSSFIVNEYGSWCSLYQALDIALTYNTSLYVW